MSIVWKNGNVWTQFGNLKFRNHFTSLKRLHLHDALKNTPTLFYKLPTYCISVFIIIFYTLLLISDLYNVITNTVAYLYRRKAKKAVNLWRFHGEKSCEILTVRYRDKRREILSIPIECDTLEMLYHQWTSYVLSEIQSWSFPMSHISTLDIEVLSSAFTLRFCSCHFRCHIWRKSIPLHVSLGKLRASLNESEIMLLRTLVLYFRTTILLYYNMIQYLSPLIFFNCTL